MKTVLTALVLLSSAIGLVAAELPIVTLTLPDPMAAESGSDPGTIRFWRNTSLPTETTVFFTVSGTATPGSDYAALGTSIVIPANATTVATVVTPVDDTFSEDSETVIVTIVADASYSIGTIGTATVTIADNDLATVTVTASDATAAETGGDTGTFTISRDTVRTVPLTVSFTVGGSANSGSDYTSIGTSVVIPANQTSTTVTVTPIDDASKENPESVVLTVSSNGTHTAGSPASATVIIESNEVPTVTVSATDATASEPGTNTGTFRFTRDISPSTATVVVYTVSGTATSGSDFTALSGTATIAGSTSTVDVTLTALDDALVENAETVVVTITTSSAYDVGSPSTATVTIADNELPTVTVVATDASAAETGGDTGTFTVSRDVALNTSLTVDFTVTGSANSGSDYTSMGTSVVILANNLSATVAVTPIDDATKENPETVVLTVSTTATQLAGSPASATVTIESNEVPTVTVSATDATASEPGTNSGTFRFTRDISPSTATVVSYTVSGTATSGSDFTALSGTATISGSDTTVDVTLTALDNALPEDAETVIVTVATSTAYTVGSPSVATVTISDNDLPTVTVAASDATAAETGGDTGSFTVTRDVALSTTLTVAYSVSGSATSGSDFTSIGTSVVIPANQLSATVTVTPIDDATKETPETVVLTVATNATHVAGTPASATVTISSNEVPVVTVSATDATASEPGTNTGTFRFTRDISPSTATVVSYTVSGTATSGSDFTALSGTATINGSATTADVTLTALDNALPEDAETVVVTIVADATYAAGSPSAATVTISDNDLPTVTVVASDATAAETGGDTGAFTVTRDVALSTALTVTYSVSGSATSGSDFTSIGTSVVIPANQLSATVTVTPIDDATKENPETVVLTVATNSTHVAGTPATATVTISSNEVPVVTVSATDATASEPGTNTGTFRFTRDISPSTSTVVLYAVSGTATSGNDFTALSGTATIGGGATTVDVTLTTLDNALPEDAETVVVTITADAAYALGSPSVATVTISDNDLPTVTVVATDSAAETGVDTGTFVVSRDVALSSSLTVSYAVSGTAVSGSDFTSIGTSVVIPANQLSASVIVSPIDDVTKEDPETVVLTVSTTGTQLAGTPASATVVITSNEGPTVTVTATDATASEPGSNSGSFRFTRDISPSTATVVSYTVSGTATSGSDFTALSGTATIPGSGTTVNVTLTALDDILPEDAETVIVSVSASPSYFLGSPSTATVTISDDDLPTVTVAATDATAAEAGADTGTFTVSRDVALSTPLTVSYTVSGSANSGSDFTSIGNSVVIPANTLSATVTVTPIDDATKENPETVVLTVSTNATQVAGSPASAMVTIASDEQPVVTVAATDATASEPGTNTGTFTFTRDISPSTSTVISYSVSGTATSGVDFTALSGTATITSGNTTTTVMLTALDDVLHEGPETVVVTVAADAAYAVGSPASATVTIADDDLPTVTVVATDPNAAEVGNDTGTFTVSRALALPTSLTVSFTRSGTATSGSDFPSIGTSVVIPASQTSATVTVTPTNDSALEDPETIVLTLDADVDYIVGSPSSATVTLVSEDLPTITVVAFDADAGEPSGNGQFRFYRNGATLAEQTVYFTVSGTATNGTDYQAIGSSATILSSDDYVILTIDPSDDNIAEDDETVIVTVVANAAYTVGSPSSDSVLIDDNDNPTITITATDAVAAETGGNTGTFTLSRGTAFLNPLTVYFVVSGTADEVDDFANISSSSLTIPANAATATITITPIDDADVESAETVTITLDNRANYDIGTPAAATVTIDSDDLPTVTVTATDALASESGSNTGTFRFTRNTATSDSVIVHFTVSGTATSGSDFTAIGTTATIVANNTFVDVTLTAINDAVAEDAETVVVTIDVDVAYTIGASSTATVTISDNDLPTITVTATDDAAAELGLATGTFTVSRGVVLSSTLAVSVSISGTATAGADYVAITAPVTIPANQASATVQVTPLDDAIAENDETVILTITANAPLYTVGAPSVATVTLVSDDLPTITVTATDASAAEAGLDAGQFTVSRGVVLATATTVTYAVSGTATAGSDYTTLSGTVVIAAGTSSAPIPVTPLDDVVVEDPETVIVTVSANAAYTVGAPSSATVTIASDDLPTITVTATDAAAAEAGLDAGQFTVSRGVVLATATTVSYAVSGTATAGSDYTSLSGTVTIAAGASSAPVPVTPLDDVVAEDPETVIVTVSANAAYTVGAPSSATVTITSDDLPTVTVTATDATAAEAGLDAGQFTVSRGVVLSTATTVSYGVSGTATAGSDYTSLSGTVTIAAGASSAPIPLSPLDDVVVEDPETVIVTVSANAAYMVGAPSSATVTITSDDLPTITVTATDAAAAEAGLDAGQFTVSRGVVLATATTVTYAVSGTATAGSDYTSLSGTVTIAAGASSAPIPMTPLDDVVAEDPETVIVTVSANAAYTVGAPSSATVTITSDDLPTITVTATDAAAAEASLDAGQFMVSRSVVLATATTVSYAVSGTATAGSDYTSLSGTVTIAAGASSAPVPVTPLDDVVAEDPETVIVTVSANAAYTVGAPSSATVTITSDDVPTVTVTATDASAAEAGPDAGTFTVSRGVSLATATVVTYAVSGTATAVDDYEALAGTVTIPAMASSALVQVMPVDDAVADSAETVIITLQTDPAYVIGSPSTATVTIICNDTAPTIVAGPSVSPSQLKGIRTATLSVLGADNGGEPNLTYTWATSGAQPGTVTFSTNGTNGAKTTQATVSALGTYTVTVTITDLDLESVTSEPVTIYAVSKPEVAPIPEQTVIAGGKLTVTLQISDSDFPPEDVLVSGWSSDIDLIIENSVSIQGTGAERTLTLFSMAGTAGTAEVQLYAADSLVGDYFSFPVTVVPFEEIVFAPHSGSYFAIPPVTIATHPAGGDIWYTTSTSGIPEDPVPGQGSAVHYTGPITLLATTTIKAKFTAGDPGGPTAMATYTLRDQSSYGFSGGGSATSSTSPYCALGTGSTDKISITASSVINGAVSGVVPVTVTGSNSYFADAPLAEEGITEIRFAFTDENGTTITRTQLVSRTAISLASSGGEIITRVGDTIRFTVPDQDGITVTTGLGASPIAVPKGNPVFVTYPSPGLYQVRVFHAEGWMQGWRNVRVIGVNFPTDMVACEVNCQRTLTVPVLPLGSADIVSFISGDTDYLTVGSTADYDNANLTLKPLQRGLCVALAQINGTSGPIVSALRVREFQFDVVKTPGANSGLIIMRPFLPGIVPENTFSKADHDEFTQEDINTWSSTSVFGQANIPRPEIYQPPTGMNRVRITREEAITERITTVDFSVSINPALGNFQGTGVMTMELTVNWSDPDGDGAPNWSFSALSPRATVSPPNQFVSKRFSVSRPVDLSDLPGAPPEARTTAREMILREYAPAMSQRHSGNTNPIAMPSRLMWPFPDGMNSELEWNWNSQPYQDYTGYVPFDLSYLAQINIGVGLGAGGLYVPLYRPINNPQWQNSPHLVWTVSGPGGSATYDTEVYYGPGGEPIPTVSTTVGAGGMTQITTTMTTGHGNLEPAGITTWETSGSPSGWLGNVNAPQGSALTASVRPGVYWVSNVEVKVNGLAAVFATDWSPTQPPMTFSLNSGPWENSLNYLYAGMAQGMNHPAHWTYRDIGSDSPHYFPISLYNYPVPTSGTIAYTLVRSTPRVQFYKDAALTQAVFSGQATEATVTLPGSSTGSGIFAKPSTQEEVTLRVSTGSCIGGELTIAFVGAGTGQPAPRDATAAFFDGRLQVNHGVGNAQMTFPVIANRSGRIAPELFLSYNSHDGTNCGYGPGWRTNYDMRILGAVYNNTVTGSAKGFVLVDETGGRRILSDAGVFREPMRPDTIFQARRADTPPPDAADWETGEWFRIVRRGGERCYFDDKGWLKRIQHPDGQVLTIARDGTTHKITTIAVKGSLTTLNVGALLAGGNDTTPMTSLNQLESGKWDFTYLPLTGPNQLPMLKTAKISGTSRTQTGVFSLVDEQTDITATLAYDANSLRLTSVSFGNVGNIEAKTTFDLVTNDSDYPGEDCVRETGNLSGLRKWFLKASNSPTVPMLIDEAGIKHFQSADDQRIYQSYHGTTGQRYRLVDFAYDGVGNLTKRTTTLDTAGTKRTEEFVWESLTKAEGQLEITGTNVLKSSRVIGVAGIEGVGTTDVTTTSEYSKDPKKVGYLIQGTDSLGTTRKMDYANNVLTKLSQVAGETTLRSWTLTPDSEGRPTKIQTPGQRYARTDYPANQPPSANTWSQPPVSGIPYLGFKTTTVRDQAQRVITTYPPGGEAAGVYTETDYDPLGRVTRQRDEEGRVTTYKYDVLGRLRNIHRAPTTPDTLPTGLVGQVTYATIPDDAIAYDFEGYAWLVTATRQSLVLSKQRFDLIGRLIEDIETHSMVNGSTQEGTTSYYYDPVSGYLDQIDDARGFTTTQQSDRIGRVITVSPPAPAGQIQRTYNVLDWLLSQTDGNQLTTRFTYDQGGRVVRTINPAGGWIQQSYDASGKPCRTTTSQGMAQRVENDADGVTKKSFDAFGNSITFDVDTTYGGGEAPLTELTFTAARDGTTMKRKQHVRADALPDKVTTEVAGQAFDTALVPTADGSIGQVTPHGLGPQGTCRDGYGRPVLMWTTARLDGQDKPVAMTIEYDSNNGLVKAKRWLAPLGRTDSYDRNQITGEIDSLRSNAHQPKGSQIPVSANESRVWKVLERDVAGNVKRFGRFKGTEASSDDPQLVTVQVYDALGRPTEVTPPGGPMTKRIYDAGGRLTDLERDGVNIMHQTYDVLGNVTERRKADVIIQTATFDDIGRMVRQTTGTDTRTWEFHPVTGFLTRIVGPGTRVLERIPDAKGRLWQVKQNGVLLREIHYDDLDRVSDIEHGDQKTEDRLYAGDSSRVTNATDRAGRTTVNQYDNGGALASSVITNNGVSTTLVVTHGQVTGADGSPAGVREQRQVNGGPVLATETDRAGRPSAITQPGLPEVATVYDVAGRVQSRGDVTYGYDQHGRLGTITHDNNTATFGYDQLGRVGTLTLPNGVTRGWTYDGIHDYVTQMIQSINGQPEVWDVTRDVRGRVRAVTSSIDGTARYIYSGERLVQESSVPAIGQVVQYAYDERDNRIRTVTFTGISAQSQDFGTDGVFGALAPASGQWAVAAGVATVSGDGAAVLTPSQGTLPIGPEVSVAVRPGVPTAGEIRGGIALDAGAVTYEAVWEVSLTTGFAPSPQGRLVVRSRSGQQVTVLATGAFVLDDGLAATTVLIRPLPQNLLQVESSGPSGTTRVELLAPGVDTTTGVGTVSLFGEATNGATASVAFDNLSWQDATLRTAQVTAFTAFNQLDTEDETTSDGGMAHTVYSHDDLGQLLGTQRTGQGTATTSYDYDEFGRMTAATVGGMTTTLTYDADQWFRRSQTTGTTTTTFANDGQGLFRQTVTASGQAAITTTMVRNGRIPLWESSNAASGLQTYAHDVQGNVIGVVGQFGNGMPGYRSRYDFNAYGKQVRERMGQINQSNQPELVSLSAPTNSPGPRYRGMWFDGGTGLYATQTRPYSPGMGRFMQVDPARAGQNWYAYCGGDPVNRSDPSGLDYINVGIGMDGGKDDDAVLWLSDDFDGPSIGGYTKGGKQAIGRLDPADRSMVMLGGGGGRVPLASLQKLAEGSHFLGDSGFGDNVDQSIGALQIAIAAAQSFQPGLTDFTGDEDPVDQFLAQRGGDFAWGVKAAHTLQRDLAIALLTVPGGPVDAALGKVIGAGGNAISAWRTARAARKGSRGLSDGSQVAGVVERYTARYESRTAGEAQQIGDLLASLEKRGLTTEEGAVAAYSSGKVIFGASTRRWEVLEEFMHHKVAQGWGKQELESLSRELLAKRIKVPGGVRSPFQSGAQAAAAAEEILVKQFLLRGAKQFGLNEAEIEFLKAQIQKLSATGLKGGY